MTCLKIELVNNTSDISDSCLWKSDIVLFGNNTKKKIIINKIDFKSFIIYEIDVLTAFWLLPNSLNFYSSPYAFSAPSIISPML